MIMMRIEWTDEFKVGVPALDEDHQHLLAMANDFLEAAQNSRPVGELAAIFDRLLRHTREHFAAEEKLLDRHNYPSLAAHKAEHDRLMTVASNLHARFAAIGDAEVGNLTLETADFLQHWLLDHIRLDDKPYRPFLMSLA